MDTIVRKVIAPNKETAIGLYIIQTEELKFLQKLNVECIDLEELKTIESENIS